MRLKPYIHNVVWWIPCWQTHLFKMKLVSSCDELEVYTSCTVLMPLTNEPIRFTSAVDWWDQYHIFLSCHPKWLKGGERHHTSAFMPTNILRKQYTSWWKTEFHGRAYKHATLCTYGRTNSHTHHHHVRWGMQLPVK